VPRQPFPKPPPLSRASHPSPLRREKLKARFGNVETRIGGKGTTHRPAKTTNKTSAVDEKKLQAGLKKLAVSAVPGIETVQIIKSDSSVVQFSSPKGSWGG
jgi:hypothetical protein